MQIQMANGARMIGIPNPKSDKTYVVVPLEGRFLVCRKSVGGYFAVDDCRTEAFAQMRADFLNGQS